MEHAMKWTCNILLQTYLDRSGVDLYQFPPFHTYRSEFFCNKYVFRKKQNFPSWNLENGLDSQ